MTDRTELRRLLAEGTPGPWEVSNDDQGVTHIWNWRSHCWPGIVLNNDLGRTTPEDLALITAAVNALPGLLGELEAAEVALRRVRMLCWEGSTAPDGGAVMISRDFVLAALGDLGRPRDE